MGQILPGTEDPKLTGDEDCDGFSSSEPIFAAAFGDGGEQRGLAVAVDKITGHIYVAGAFNGSLTFGDDVLISNDVADTGDIFVTKLDSDGKPVWAKQFGDAGGDQGVQGLAVDDAGGVVMTGYNEYGVVDFGGGPVSSGIFVTKLAADGSHEWSLSCGSDLGHGTSVATTKDGAVIVTGSFGGTMNCGVEEKPATAFDDIFLLKLSATGDVVWHHTFAGTSMDEGGSVVVDPFDNVFLTGRYFGDLDLQGNVLTDDNQWASFVTKRASDGSHLWSRPIDGTGNQLAGGLAATPAGGVTVVGSFQGTITFSPDWMLTSDGGADAFVIAYGAAGDVAWADSFGASADQVALAVAVDAKGRTDLTGIFDDGIDLGSGLHGASSPADGFIAQLLGDGGGHRWDRAFGGAIFNLALALGPSDEVVLVGTADGTIDFGLGPTVTKGKDLFVTMLAP